MRIPLRRSGLLATAVAVAGSLAATLTGPAVTHGEIVRAAAPQPVTAVADSSVATGLLAAARIPGPPGYVMQTAGIIGETPLGMRVWVDPHTAHHANIARYTQNAVRQWRRLGLKVSYAGYGTPKLTEGVIAVTEGPAGCGPGGQVGLTWVSWLPLASNKDYVHHSRVVICPGLYRYPAWQQSATVHHELGHAVGLGHYNGVYRGRTQVMRWQNHGGVANYQAGDLNGLRFLANHGTAVRNSIPPTGKLEATDLVDDTHVSITGWAYLPYAKAAPVKIVVTDNGVVVSSASTTVVRADINAKVDPGTQHPHGFSVTVPYDGKTHVYSVTAVSPTNPAAKASIGSAEWM